MYLFKKTSMLGAFQKPGSSGNTVNATLIILFYFLRDSAENMNSNSHVSGIIVVVRTQDGYPHVKLNPFCLWISPDCVTTFPPGCFWGNESCSISNVMELQNSELERASISLVKIKPAELYCRLDGSVQSLHIYLPWKAHCPSVVWNKSQGIKAQRSEPTSPTQKTFSWPRPCLVEWTATSYNGPPWSPRWMAQGDLEPDMQEKTFQLCLAMDEVMFEGLM